MDQEHKPSNYLLYWREKRGLSLEKLSAKLALNGDHSSAKTLNRWEKGQGALPQWAPAALAKVFKVSELEISEGPLPKQIELPTNQSLAFTGVDMALAEHIIEMAYTSWIASRPVEAKQGSEMLLPLLEASLRRAPVTRQTKQNKHLLARNYELLGAIALDQLDNETAINRFWQALTLSEELNTPDLIAAHTTELGEALRRTGKNEDGLELMLQGLNYAAKGGRATQGYVHEMIAYVYAEVGDEQQFIRHIEQSLDLLGHSGEGEGVSRRDFIPFEVLEIYGKALRDFGHPTKALTYINHAEKALHMRPMVPRWQALITITKAQAMCDIGQIEEGMQLAAQGITLAHACQSPRQMNRVRKLLKKVGVSEYKDAPSVRALRETVANIYTADKIPHDWRPQHAM